MLQHREFVNNFYETIISVFGVAFMSSIPASLWLLSCGTVANNSRVCLWIVRTAIMFSTKIFHCLWLHLQWLLWAAALSEMMYLHEQISCLYKTPYPFKYCQDDSWLLNNFVPLFSCSATKLSLFVWQTYTYFYFVLGVKSVLLCHIDSLIFVVFTICIYVISNSLLKFVLKCSYPGNT